MPCTKRCYQGKHAARAAAAGASFRIRTYFCDECHAWHVTNAEKEGHNDRRGPGKHQRWKGER